MNIFLGHFWILELTQKYLSWSHLNAIYILNGPNILKLFVELSNNSVSIHNNFQNLLKSHKNFLDTKLISEIDKLILKINIDDFINQQQAIVLLNYIYSDLKDNNLSEIDKSFLELKEYLSKLVK